MNVLLVCSASFRTGQTGDATQARETVAALEAAGESVRVLYVRYFPLVLEDLNGTEFDRRTVAECAAWADVIHLLPCNPIVTRFFRSFPHKPTVGSTIYWGGWERVRIAWRTAQGLKVKIHDALRYWRDMTPIFKDLRGVDVFLPNSRAEGACALAHMRHDANTIAFPVPNGFVAPSFDVAQLPRSEGVPRTEYVVVPGVFANRKNHLGLIRAVRDLPYDIVFVGGRVDTPQGRRYFERCRSEANERMHFLGFVSSRSEDYWKILRHARVAVLPSDCETPGIAMIEAAFAGARPCITKFGGTVEYFGFDGEYFDPCASQQMRAALTRAWQRGRLGADEARVYQRYSWQHCAELTLQAYHLARTMS